MSERKLKTRIKDHTMVDLPTAEDIRRIRKSSGLTQQDVAKKAAVSQSLIARIEMGTVDPRLSTVRKILKVISEHRQEDINAIEIAVSKVITIQDTTTVSEASELLFTKGFSQVPVCDATGKIIGAIKESTITKNVIDKGAIVLMQPVRQILNREDALPMLPISASLKSVEDLLIHHGHAAVLLMEEGNIAGIITKADVIKNYLR
jgi:predicted transcriptional regulator